MGIMSQTYRCPVNNLLADPTRADAFKAEADAKGLTGQARLDLLNELDRCDQAAAYVKFLGEEIMIRSGTKLEDQPRTGKGHLKGIATQRNVLVRCPIHGEQIWWHNGTHVTAVDTRVK
jgi:hypothetical protein